MTKRPLNELNDTDLVDLFAHYCVQQDIGLLGKGAAYFNRYYDRMDAVAQELKRREGDHRRALLPLFNHPNMQVRVQAAKETFAVAPVEARRQLEEVIASKWFPQAGDAGMFLRGLDQGAFRPE